MKIEIEVNNVADSPVADDFFAAVAEKTIRETGYDFLRGKKISVSVAMVSEEEMQKLNKQCRQHDSVTDVLSFYEYESIEQIKNVTEPEIFLGELILCYDDIVKYATEEKIDLKEELTNVFSHGILHLLGFKHGEEMFTIQNKVSALG